MSFTNVCRVCNMGIMEHNQLYTYTCNYCGYSFRIDPAGKRPKITILNEGMKL